MMKNFMKLKSKRYMYSKYCLKGENLEDALKKLEKLLSDLEGGKKLLIKDLNLESAIIAAALWCCNCDTIFEEIDGESVAYIYKK
ncbi:MAG: hypothetical protein J5507_02835 [Clostridia bacterium]|nr:hypothetical protein [Clostridia bacterium]